MWETFEVSKGGVGDSVGAWRDHRDGPHDVSIASELTGGIWKGQGVADRLGVIMDLG
jgi:hypothetical protein